MSLHSFHALDAVWQPAMARAKREGITLKLADQPAGAWPRIARRRSWSGSNRELVTREYDGLPVAGGSGRLPNQRRSRKARSFMAWLPDSATAMTVSAATTISMLAMTSPSNHVRPTRTFAAIRPTAPYSEMPDRRIACSAASHAHGLWAENRPLLLRRHCN